MSIIISGIKIDINDDDSQAFLEASKKYNIKNAKMHVHKKSIDARRGEIKKVVSIICYMQDEEKFVEKISDTQVKLKKIYEEFVPSGTKKLGTNPIVIGLGPAGLMCSYELAKNGYSPIVFELGEDIDNRDLSVDNFLKNGIFNKNSNIQFGEGGAGSYSDGKLTTRTNDVRSDYILDILHKNGAPDDILHLSKPHIGTDILKNVVKNIRNEIIKLGGTVHFNSKLTDVSIKNGKLQSICVNGQKVSAEVVVLAIGHSARDTFSMLYSKGVFIEPKAFSIGARIEHLQQDIDKSLYGKHFENPNLPAAEYNLANTKDGRGCYTFCMCPGGIVVPSNSEENSVVTNGMSYHSRDGKNANSAVVVSVTPKDFETSHALAGIDFQRKIEQTAFLKAGSNYKAPAVLVEDFLEDRRSSKFKNILPTYERQTEFCKFSEILPKFITDSMVENLSVFARKIKSFDHKSAVLTAPETRTSSPVRITRNESFVSINTEGLMPCGEGAGYAGGIISAAVDGIKCAEKIMEVYKGE